MYPRLVRQVCNLLLISLTVAILPTASANIRALIEKLRMRKRIGAKIPAQLAKRTDKMRYVAELRRGGTGRAAAPYGAGRDDGQARGNIARPQVMNDTDVAEQCGIMPLIAKLRRRKLAE
jgi:hypothetical protein